MSAPPPMPWRLLPRGPVLATLHAVPVERARRLVPEEYTIVSVAGRTLGGLFVARYGPGSALEYSELIAACGVVRRGSRLGLWITHLFVDSPDSVRGGRELIGVPKHLAPFAWEEGRRRVAAGPPERPLCRIRRGRSLRLWRQRLRLLSFHRDVRDAAGGDVSLLAHELWGRWGVTRARVEIPEESPLRELGLGRPLLAVCGEEAELRLGEEPSPPPAGTGV